MAMTSQRKAELEKKLGRPLSIREAIFEEIDYEDNRPREQRFDWKPILQQAPVESKFDHAIREAEREAREEALTKMSPLERRVAMLKQAKIEELQAKASAREHQKRLATPEIAKPLEALNALLKSYEWNPDVGLAEVESVRRALDQYSTPSADLAVAKEMLDGCFASERARRTAIRDAVAEKMGELGAQKAELDAAIQALNPVQQPEPVAVAAADVDAAWANYQKADAGSPNALALREHWSKLYVDSGQYDQAMVRQAAAQEVQGG